MPPLSLLKLKHVDIARQHVRWDAREVATKAAKSFDAYFYPVGDDVRQIVEERVTYLAQKELLWGPDDPLFPATRQEVGPDRLIPASRPGPQALGNRRPVVRERLPGCSFAAVGLPYSRPHRVRDTISTLGQEDLFQPGVLKAWSQNMGHESITTTVTSYGPVSSHRQGS